MSDGVVLTKSEILSLIKNEKMIQNYVDLNLQLNDHGFDLTVSKIYKPQKFGVIDFDNSLRTLPEYLPLRFQPISIKGKVVDGIILNVGAYVIEINELIKLPKNVCAIALPRSSLIRSGATICSALWDAGYCGKGKLLLLCHNNIVLVKNARIAQMVFFKLTSEVNGYNGIYQNEGGS